MMPAQLLAPAAEADGARSRSRVRRSSVAHRAEDLDGLLGDRLELGRLDRAGDHVAVARGRPSGGSTSPQSSSSAPGPDLDELLAEQRGLAQHGDAVGRQLEVVLDAAW